MAQVKNIHNILTPLVNISSSAKTYRLGISKSERTYKATSVRYDTLQLIILEYIIRQPRGLKTNLQS